MLKLGIVYEGPADTGIINEVLKKLLPESSFFLPEDCDIRIGTGIIGSVKPQARNLFEKSGVDFAAFLTDQDVPADKDKRRLRICKDLEELGYRDRSAVGVADPTIEAWLFADEDIIKSILNLPGETPLPYPLMSNKPKERLKMIISNVSGERMSEYEIKAEIIKLTSLDKLRLIPDFNLFADNLLQVFNFLNTVKRV